MKRLRPAALTLPLALAVAVTACGDETVTTGGGSTPTRPTGADEVVVQVLVEGGFVPVEVALGSVPTVTVLGNGTVITQAPVPAIYPGPAIPPLQSVDVDPATVDGLVNRAATLGLLDEPLDFGRPPVADAPFTIVTIAANGRTYRHQAYALGLSDDAAGGRTGLSEKAVANRRSLQTFVEATNQLPPGKQPWMPQSVAVSVVGPYQPEPQLPQRPAAWPLARAPEVTGNRPCTLITGDDVRLLLAAVSQANARTPWTISGTPYSIAFWPVVPGAAGCPS